MYYRTSMNTPSQIPSVQEHVSKEKKESVPESVISHMRQGVRRHPFLTGLFTITLGSVLVYKAGNAYKEYATEKSAYEQVSGEYEQFSRAALVDPLLKEGLLLESLTGEVFSTLEREEQVFQIDVLQHEHDISESRLVYLFRESRTARYTLYEYPSKNELLHNASAEDVTQYISTRREAELNVFLEQLFLDKE